MDKRVFSLRALLYCFTFLIAVGVGSIHLSSILHPGFIAFDDAYMFMRYAKHIVDGHSMVWNIGEEVIFGVTSLSYMTVVYLLNLLTNLTDEQILAIGSNLPAMASLFLLAALTSKLVNIKDQPKHIHFCIFFCFWSLYFCYFSVYVAQAANGMETTLSMFLLLLFCWQLLKCLETQHTQSIALLALVSYLAVLTRPENILVVSLTPFFLFICYKKMIKTAVTFAILLSGLILIDSVVKFLLFNDVLPLSYYAKRSNYLDGYLGWPIWHPYQTIFHFLLPLAPFSIFIINALLNKRFLLVLCFILPIAITFYFLFNMMLIMNIEGRYFFPFSVFIIFSCLFFFREFLNSSRRNQCISAAITLVIFSGLFLAEQNKQSLMQNHKFATTPCAPTTEFHTRVQHEPDKGKKAIIQFGEFLRNSSSGDSNTSASIVMSEYGFIGAKFPDITIVDTVGLHDPQLAHNGFDAQRIFDKKPDAIWFPHRHYTCINAAIIDSKEFWDEYEYYPGLFLHGFALRKDSDFYPAFYKSAELHWLAFHPDSELRDGLAIKQTP